MHILFCYYLSSYDDPYGGNTYNYIWAHVNNKNQISSNIISFNPQYRVLSKSVL